MARFAQNQTVRVNIPADARMEDDAAVIEGVVTTSGSGMVPSALTGTACRGVNPHGSTHDTSHETGRIQWPSMS